MKPYYYLKQIRILRIYLEITLYPLEHLILTPRFFVLIMASAIGSWVKEHIAISMYSWILSIYFIISFAILPLGEKKYPSFSKGKEYL
jgi:hypothetical protein